jgi:hypothetical protein
MRRARRLSPSIVVPAITLVLSITRSAPGQVPSCPDASSLHPVAHCGTERWAAKTLSDSKSASIDFSQTPQVMTLTEVNQLTGHCHPGMNLRRTFPEELKIFEVTGWVRCVKKEQDRDYHIAIFEEDAVDAPSMVVEVIDPGCQGAKTSPEHERLVNARAAFMQLTNSKPHDLLGKQVKVTGVGFFDLAHGQTGISSSCMELHPVLTIELVP